MFLKAGKWARCSRGQRQAAAIALRAACSGIASKRHTQTEMFADMQVCSGIDNITDNIHTFANHATVRGRSGCCYPFWSMSVHTRGEGTRGRRTCRLGWAGGGVTDSSISAEGPGAMRARVAKRLSTHADLETMKIARYIPCQGGRGGTAVRDLLGDGRCCRCTPAMLRFMSATRGD